MRRAVLPVLAVLVTACSPQASGHPASLPTTDSARASVGAPAGSASSAPAAGAVPDGALPPSPLRPLVPSAADLPPGLIAIRAGSGPRDARALSGYSADPASASVLLARHGFRSAYVAQYADPATGRLLSVVVSRFATPAGAEADLAADLDTSAGRALTTPTIGARSGVRTQVLPKGRGELVTVRFVVGNTTWLVAYGASPSADPAVALAVARRLAGRG